MRRPHAELIKQPEATLNTVTSPYRTSWKTLRRRKTASTPLNAVIETRSSNVLYTVKKNGTLDVDQILKEEKYPRNVRFAYFATDHYLKPNELPCTM